MAVDLMFLKCFDVLQIVVKHLFYYFPFDPSAKKSQYALDYETLKNHQVKFGIAWAARK